MRAAQAYTRRHTKSQKDHVDQLAGENVSPQTDGKGKQARGVADDLYRENQPSQPPDGTGKMLGISDGPTMPQSAPVVIGESQNGAGQRNAGVSRGRLKTRERAEGVGEQNKNRNRTPQREV